MTPSQSASKIHDMAREQKSAIKDLVSTHMKNKSINDQFFNSNPYSINEKLQTTNSSILNGSDGLPRMQLNLNLLNKAAIKPISINVKNLNLVNNKVTIKVSQP